MGFVDRGGGRESKNSSLRRSKKNPGCAVSREAAGRQPQRGPSLPDPPKPFSANTAGNIYFDTSASLLSRQFDNDLSQVIMRAKGAPNMCCGVLIWSADADKQSALIRLSNDHTGFLYSVIGIHPDNIDKTHHRGFDTLTDNIESLSKSSGCIGVLSGLNLTREVGTHFAQETSLKSMMRIAVSCGRPLVLHCVERDNASMDRLVVLLEEWCRNGYVSDDENDENNDIDQEIEKRVDIVTCLLPNHMVLHNGFLAANYRHDVLQKLVKMGVFIEVSAARLEVFSAAYKASLSPIGESDVEGYCQINARLEELKNFTKALLPTSLMPNVDVAESCTVIPKSSILFGSDSPWCTPQTIDDDYLRTEKNEPSNMESVISAVELALFQGAMLLTNDKHVNQANLKGVIHIYVAELVEESKKTAVKVFKIPAVTTTAPVEFTPDTVNVTVPCTVKKYHMNHNTDDVGIEKSFVKDKGKKGKHSNKRCVDSVEGGDSDRLREAENELETFKNNKKGRNKKGKEPEDQMKQSVTSSSNCEDLKRKSRVKCKRIEQNSDSEDAHTLEKIHAALMSNANQVSDVKKALHPLSITKNGDSVIKKACGDKRVEFAIDLEIDVTTTAHGKTELNELPYVLPNEEYVRETNISNEEAIICEETEPFKERDELKTICVSNSDILMTNHRIPDGRPTLMYNCSKCRITLFSSMELIDVLHGMSEIATKGMGGVCRKDTSGGKSDAEIKVPFYFLKPLSQIEEEEIQRLILSRDGSGDTSQSNKKTSTVYSYEMLNLLPSEELFGVSRHITIGDVRAALPITLRLCDSVGTLECTKCGHPKVGTVFLIDNVSEEGSALQSFDDGERVSIICRITASKVDTFDHEDTIGSLQRRAHDEAGCAYLKDELRRQQILEEEIAMKERKHQRKKNVKSNNKSNFTNFRNKNFALGNKAVTENIVN